MLATPKPLKMRRRVGASLTLLEDALAREERNKKQNPYATTTTTMTTRQRVINTSLKGNETNNEDSMCTPLHYTPYPTLTFQLERLQPLLLLQSPPNATKQDFQNSNWLLTPMWLWISHHQRPVNSIIIIYDAAVVIRPEQHRNISISITI